MKSSKPLQSGSYVEDLSSERVDCSWSRNAWQAAAGFELGLIGAAAGFWLSPSENVFDSLACAAFGWAGGAIAGIFAVGIVLAALPKTPTRRTIHQIAARRRAAQRQLVACYVLLSLAVTLLPWLWHAENPAAWLAWVCVTGVLYTNANGISCQLAVWKCPNCQQRYSGSHSHRNEACNHCGFNLNSETNDAPQLVKQSKLTEVVPKS